MSKCFGVTIFCANSSVSRTAVALTAVLLLSTLVGNPSESTAQVLPNGTIIRQIGGVHIDANGVVNTTTETLRESVREQLLENLGPVPEALVEQAEMRVISLRGLHAEIEKAAANETSLSDDVMYLAGMTRVQYIFVDQENDDVLIAGPGEGWTVSDSGDVVGIDSGRPVLQLADLIVALRTANAARQDFGISVSINPTEEGNVALRDYYARFRRSGRRFDATAATEVEQTLGSQNVTLTGIPTDSRFAQVLVAADYQMKRLSMGFERAPIDGMPSFLEICQKAKTRARSITPRFWMECDYQPVKHNADKTAWEISGSVKALTETEFMTPEGEREGTGRSNKFAKRWADSMTEHYDELASEMPIFADLNNLMDLTVVAALIQQHGLLEMAELEIPMMLDPKRLPTPTWNVAQTVPSQCSFCSIARGRGAASTLITVSGGVQLDSWGVIEKVAVDTDLNEPHNAAIASTQKSWWWNTPTRR